MKDMEPWIRGQRTDTGSTCRKGAHCAVFYGIILNNKSLRNCIINVINLFWTELVSPGLIVKAITVQQLIIVDDRCYCFICSILSLQFSYLDRELSRQRGANSYRLGSPFYFERSLGPHITQHSGSRAVYLDDLTISVRNQLC